MLENFEMNGWWWLPGKDAERVSGVMAFDAQTGPVLRTLGQLGGPGPIVTDFPSFPVIHGTTADGKDVTLLHCQLTSLTQSYPRGIPEAEYSSALCLRNALLDEATGFWAAETDISDLVPWLTPTVFSFNYRQDRGSLLDYSPLTPLQTFFPGENEADSGCQIMIDGRIRSTEKHYQHQISYCPVLRLNIRKPVPISHVLSLATCALQFFELGCASPLLPGGVRFYLSPLRTGMEADYVEVFFQQVPGEHRPPLRDLHDLLFNYGDVAQMFPSLMRGWLKSYDNIASSIRLHSQLLYSSGPPEYSFLACVFALEAYYRDAVAGRPLDDDSFSSSVEKILAVVPDEQRAFWRTKLRYANEYNLRDRLLGMCDRIPELAGFLHLTEGFIGKVVNTRNLLAHQSVGGNQAVWREPEEFKIPNIQLQLFLEAVLVGHLGVPETDVIKWFGNNRTVRGLSKLFGTKT